MLHLRLTLLFCMLLPFFTVKMQAQTTAGTTFKVKLDSMVLHDNARHRMIPVAMYYQDTLTRNTHNKVVILSHGYGANNSRSYLQYSSIANFLATRGYVVISIQHELPTDSLIPDKGIPQVVRRPFWERGAENIRFVLQQTKKAFPGLDYKHVALIGHSNGGDMSMLFCHKYPELVWKVISLDNRRMALPRTAHPRVYSLRSSDQPADEGVLPTAAEQKKYKMKIVKLPNTIHNDMDDKGTGPQLKEINDYVLGFLNGN